MKRKLTAILLALLMVLSLVPAVVLPKTAVAEEKKPLEEIEGGAILHCFDWSYSEIEAHLDEIAAAGYVAVQTSPVQEPKDYRYEGVVYYGGDQWWKLYQPLGFTIAPTRDGGPSSWLGTKDDLKSLCDAAEEKGIYVIVDIVANHVANVQTGGYYQYVFNEDGTGYYVLDEQGNKKINVSDQVYDELQNPDYYHKDVNGVNDGSRYNMTQYQMGMPDLNTSSEFIQEQVYALLKECVDCGVDGFRFDAAKHIELPGDSGCGSDFWPAILNGGDTDGKIPGIRNYAGADNLFIYGESLSGNAGEAWVDEFTNNYMALTDSNYGGRMRDAVNQTNAGMLGDGSYVRCSNPAGNVVWVESHDTYEDGGSVGLTPEQIQHAWAIVGARADSTALYFARPNETMGLASSDTTWKSTAVAEVNKFKTHFDGTQEYLHSDYNNKIAWIERGTNGVVISKLDGAGSVSLTASRMKDGTYIDQVSGYTFTVAGGIISGNVGSTGVAVVYNSNEAAEDGITASKLYLVPDVWNKDGARFAMYVNDNHGHYAWVDMTDCGDGIFAADVPEGTIWTNVIFCRMNGATTENNWDNKWNQTADLFPEPGSDTYTITGWGGNDSPDPGTWSRKDAAGYYLVGNMTNWKPAAAYQLALVENSAPAEYTVIVDLAANAQFKIAYSADGKTINDSDWFPTGMGNNYGENGEITEGGRYEVHFRPDYSGSDWFYNCILVNQLTQPQFASHSLTLDGKIGVNFYMDLSMLSAEDLADAEKTYMTFTISGKGTVSSDPVPANTAKRNRSETLYCFSCYVNSIQMADTITATFHYGDDQTVTENYSAEMYIKSFEKVQSQYRDEIVALVHALADYGHYMQLFLKDAKGLPLGTDDNQYAPMDTYYVGNPALAGTDYDLDSVTESLSGYTISASNSDTNIKSLTFTVVFDSETTIRLILKPVSDFTGDLYVRVDYEDSTVPLKSKRWTVEIPNIPAHQLGDAHDIWARTDDSGGSTWTTCITVSKLSVMSYALQLLNGNEAAQNAGAAIYYYWQAAKALKEAQN